MSGKTNSEVGELRKKSKTLMSLSKSFSGRMRKYLDSIPGLDPDEASEAMRFAATRLPLMISKNDFALISYAAYATLMSLEKTISSRATGAKSMNSEVGIKNVDELRKLARDLRSACKSAASVVSRFGKVGGSRK